MSEEWVHKECAECDRLAKNTQRARDDLAQYILGKTFSLMSKSQGWGPKHHKEEWKVLIKHVNRKDVPTWDLKFQWATSLILQFLLDGRPLNVDAPYAYNGVV